MVSAPLLQFRFKVIKDETKIEFALAQPPVGAPFPFKVIRASPSLANIMREPTRMYKY